MPDDELLPVKAFSQAALDNFNAFASSDAWEKIREQARLAIEGYQECVKQLERFSGERFELPNGKFDWRKLRVVAARAGANPETCGNLTLGEIHSLLAAHVGPLAGMDAKELWHYGPEDLMVIVEAAHLGPLPPLRVKKRPPGFRIEVSDVSTQIGTPEQGEKQAELARRLHFTIYVELEAAKKRVARAIKKGTLKVQAGNRIAKADADAWLQAECEKSTRKRRQPSDFEIGTE